MIILADQVAKLPPCSPLLVKSALLVAQGRNVAPASWRKYGGELGIAFQIADDILITPQIRQTLVKAVGDDFREGK